MLKIGLITIGRDDRPWIVRQIAGGGNRLHLHGFVPDFHRGGDLPHFHFGQYTPRLDRLTRRAGATMTANRWRGWAWTVGPYVATLAGGMLLAYVLDPVGGRRRRAMARERAIGVVNRVGRRLTRLGRATGAYSQALLGKATHPRFTMSRPIDDVVLVDRVKSVLFREHDFPKGQISIGAANGSVALRGEVDRYYQIDQIEKIVWGVPGVVEVENLLHMPGTPAPNTITAIEAGR